MGCNFESASKMKKNVTIGLNSELLYKIKRQRGKRKWPNLPSKTKPPSLNLFFLGSRKNFSKACVSQQYIKKSFLNQYLKLARFTDNLPTTSSILME